MGGHYIRADDVHSDELLSRAPTVEHRVRIAGRTGLFCMDCTGKELPADAD